MFLTPDELELWGYYLLVALRRAAEEAEAEAVDEWAELFLLEED